MVEKDVVMTEELREKLNSIGAIGISTNTEFKYTPNAFRQKNKNGEYLIPKKFWPVFMLKSFSGVDSANLQDKQQVAAIPDENGGYKIKLKAGAIAVDVCKTNILGWKNFIDEDGEIIKCKRVCKELDDTTMSRLTRQLIEELSEAILTRSKMTDEEILGLE